MIKSLNVKQLKDKGIFRPQKMCSATYCIDDYDYPVPPGIIAQRPCSKREEARLLVVNRAEGKFHHSYFDNLLHWLDKNDLLVLNDTRVLSARLIGQKETGGKVEVLLIDPYVWVVSNQNGNQEFECIIRASKAPQKGSYLTFSRELKAKVLCSVREGKTRLKFITEKPFFMALEETGLLPLPPYISRKNNIPFNEDLENYQTVYAQSPGAVAAPTAGLHFGKEIIAKLDEAGIEKAMITLHVGYGTFSPVRTRDVRKHRMHKEFLCIKHAEAEKIRSARERGKRIVAVGTTVVRGLEFVVQKKGDIVPFEGFCNHYIYPGYRFKIIDRLITNFHWPRSSLILLVSALAGRELIFRSYKEAIQKGYRFFSYGDAMLIL